VTDAPQSGDSTDTLAAAGRASKDGGDLPTRAQHAGSGSLPRLAGSYRLGARGCGGSAVGGLVPPGRNSIMVHVKH
jgi:hypothetical protein